MEGWQFPVAPGICAFMVPEVSNDCVIVIPPGSQ